MAGMKDEVQGTGTRNKVGGRCGTSDGNPCSPRVRPQNSVVQETRGAIRMSVELNEQDGLGNKVDLLRIRVG